MRKQVSTPEQTGTNLSVIPPGLPAKNVIALPPMGSDEEILQAFVRGIDNIEENATICGAAVVKLTERHGEKVAFDMFMRASTKVSLSVLYSLQRVGNHLLHPFYLTHSTPIARLAMRGELAMKYQAHLASGGYVPVAVRTSSGGFMEKLKNQTEIKADEAKYLKNAKGQVIGADKQWEARLADQAAKKLRESRQKYVVDNGKIRFLSVKHLYSYDELIKAAEKIKPKASDIESSLKSNQIKGTASSHGLWEETPGGGYR
jgi:hypothetical protein